MIDLTQIVFLDVDTQVDFVMPTGTLHVPGAEALIPLWRRLVAFAADRDVPIVASLDTHTPDDPEFARWPPHCVRGTPGHEKIPGTTLPRTRRVPLDAREAAYTAGEELLIEKSIYSLFDNAATESILRQIGRPDYLVFGVATEYCVRAAALGLRERGYGALVVTDAIRAVDEEDGRRALAEMVRAGAILVSSADVLEAG